MKQNKIVNINISYIFGSLLTLTYFLLMSIDAVRSNFIVFFLNAFVVIMSIFNLFFRKNQYPFSLYKIFNLFSLLFFGITPLLQLKFDSQFFGMGYIPDDYYIKSYLTLISFLLIYDFLYSYLNNKLTGSFRIYKFFDYSYINSTNNQSFPKKNIYILGLFFVASFFTVLYICGYSIYGLLFSMLYPAVELNQSLNLFYSNFIRPFCIVLSLFYCLLGKNNYYKYLLVFISLVIILPTSIPRYMVGVLYIAMFLSCFSFFRKNNVLYYSLIGSVIYIFPLLNQVRIFSFSEYNFKFDPKVFVSAHFDSFSSYIQITNHEMITYGKQLLGTVFFFVPRFLWPEKPISSGHYYSEQLNANFNNLSVNYFAEGYINFGYIGVFIFTMLIAYYCVVMDTTYWKKNCFENKNGFTILYYLSFGLLFFVLRGDLMCSFAYSVGIYSIVLLINAILKLNTSKYI